MASGSKSGPFDLLNTDNNNEDDEYSSDEENREEIIEKIISLCNSQGNSDILGFEDVEKVASLEPPDITECDDLFNVTNVELHDGWTTDAEEDLNINNEEHGCSSGEEEEEENIENIASLMNSQGNSDIRGSENVASFEPPDITECDELVNETNVELVDWLTTDTDEHFNINNEDNGCSSHEEEEEEENIENIASLINSQGNSDIRGSENLASSEPPDLTECDDSVNVEPPKKKLRETRESRIKWQNKDLVPTLHEYNNEKSGVQLELSQSPSPLEIFECFFTNDFVQLIINEMNNHQDYVCPETEIPHASRHNQWRETDLNEFFVFLGLSLLMPLVHKQKLNDYWSKDSIIETPIFPQSMPRDRYWALLSKLHFCDKRNINHNDKLFKIRLVIDHFREKFKSVMHPFQKVAIDESLMGYKGRISFKQYIPSKRHRFGIKYFVLADCETGFILDFIVYTGSGTDIQVYDPELKIGGNIVMTLMEPYLNEGHILYVDNWYNSPVLAEALFKKKTHICGTVRANRLYMPTFQKKMVAGDVQYFSSDSLLALQWQDKRVVTMLTSCHSGRKTRTSNSRGKEIVKPECIIDYNQNMGAIDRSDMLLSSTESVRKTKKWYKKIFFHILDVTVLNSHSVYKTVTGKNFPLLEFQKQLVKEILRKSCVVKPRQTSRRPVEGHNPLRLVDRHFPAINDKCPVKNKRVPKICVVCSKPKAKKNTVYRCNSCNVPLCVVGCFERYHTVLRF